jgi:aldose 1-epimerase
MIRLTRGDFVADIRPGTGGSVWGFCWSDGVAILREAPDDGYDDARGGACFPLVPYSNRVRDGRFAFDGQDVVLAPTIPGTDTVAHGAGWRTAWAVVEQSPAHVLLRQEFVASDWPWSYCAEQRVTVEADGLSIGLTLTNLSSTTMPAGLGLHPYLPFREGVRVWFDCAQCMSVGTDGFPAADSSAGALLAQAADTGIDPAIGSRYLSGCTGDVMIVDPAARHLVSLSFSIGASNLVLYADPDGAFFCIEPVTHAVGALNDDALLDPADRANRLTPGETMELTMRCTVTRQT